MRFSRTALPALIAAVLIACPHPAVRPAAAGPELPGAAAARIEAQAERSPLKAMQMRQLALEPLRERAERRERRRELRELARELRRHGRDSIRRPGRRARPEGTLDDAFDRAASSMPAGGGARAAPARALAPPSPNVRCNDPSGDVQPASDGQSETSIAAWGDFMVAAWNDGTGFDTGAPSGDTQGWATSVDGGATWVDQGVLPHPSTTDYPGWNWVSDPVVVVNPTTGAFYYSGLGVVGSSISTVGVIKGRFFGNTFVWQTPSVARATTSSLDKQWHAVDPVSGAVYLTYTNFISGLTQIEFQSADAALSSWSAPIRLSLVSEAGYVQGSRPAVGPGGEVYVQYYRIGTVDVDYYRLLRSNDHGASFPVSSQISFFSNFGSGAPGFNREIGIEFAGLAVDRSGGPHRGRVYLSWAESLNWYDDEPGIGAVSVVGEAEPNDSPLTATPVAAGQRINGIITAAATTLSPGDLDYYSLPLAAGQTVIVECDSAQSSANFTLRLFATDGTTRLAFTRFASPDIPYRPGWIAAAPITGTYYVRVASNGGTGSYRVRTGLATRATERGGDQRDVFVAHTDDGLAWSTPVRVDTAPTGYDGWLPEVAVDAGGGVLCAWYDWRDAAAGTCGGESNVYAARSDDGGGTWTLLGATTDARTAWTNVASNIAPNQGDYLSLHADAYGVQYCWSDGRDGNPNVYMSSWPVANTSVQIGLPTVGVSGTRVSLSWSIAARPGVRGTIYRGTGGGAWTILGTTQQDSTGHLNWRDAGVTAGLSYDYRVGAFVNGIEQYFGQVTVPVPYVPELALGGVWPNPAGASARVSFTLPQDGPATLEVVDLAGRSVHHEDVGPLGAGYHVIPFSPGATLRSGIYFVRLSQRGRTLTSRVSIVR